MNPDFDLKKSTASYHEALESALYPVLFHEKLTIASYHMIIQLFYACYRQIEGQLAKFVELQAMQKDRSKIGLLKNVLAALEPYMDNKPDVSQLGEDMYYSDLPSAIGGLYVVEGATLGGNLIRKKLLEISWMSDSYLHFFTSYGDKRGAMWKVFQAYLYVYAADHPAEQARIESGAIHTFKFMQRAFQNLDYWKNKKQSH